MIKHRCLLLLILSLNISTRLSGQTKADDPCVQPQAGIQPQSVPQTSAQTQQEGLTLPPDSNWHAGLGSEHLTIPGFAGGPGAPDGVEKRLRRLVRLAESLMGGGASLSGLSRLIPGSGELLGNNSIKKTTHKTRHTLHKRAGPGKARIHLPQQNGETCFEYISPMDSSLSKEILYKNALNWYMTGFPYAYKNIIVQDQYHGKILGKCNAQFTYTYMMESYIMKIDFTVEITARYGKCRLRFYQIQPKDEVKGEESYSGKRRYSTFEERSLSRMYTQYLQTSSPPGYEREKIAGINHYFTAKILDFAGSEHGLKRFLSGKDSF